jgi:hypothetical protein
MLSMKGKTFLWWATDVRAIDFSRATDGRTPCDVRATDERVISIRSTDAAAKRCILPRRKSISVRSLTKVTSRALLAFTEFKGTSSGAPMPIKLIPYHPPSTLQFVEFKARDSCPVSKKDTRSISLYDAFFVCAS